MESLPDELLLSILSYLTETICLGPEHRCTAWALSCISKRFYALFLSVRYEEYSSRCGNPQLFLRSLTACPNAGACVKRITWAEHTFLDEEHGYPAKSLSQGEKIAVSEKLKGLGTKEAKQLARRFFLLDNTDHDDYLSAILLFTPCLEELTIWVPGEKDTS